MGLIWEGKKLHFGQPISFTKYYIDGLTICKRSGLIHIVEDQVQLYRVLDMQLKQDIIDKFFNQGTIVLYTSDRNNKEFVLEKIGNPDEVKRKLNTLVEKARSQVNIRTGEIINSQHRITHEDDGDDYLDDNGYY